MTKLSSTRAFDLHGSFYEYTHNPNSQSPTPVVLIHGVGLDHRLWDFQMPALARQFSVLRYDILGHGKTPHKPSTRSLDDYVAQLTSLLAELGLATIHLVGYSVGGLIAQRFAITQQPLLKSVTFFNSVYRRTPAELEAVTKRLAMTESHGAAATVESAITRWFTEAFIDENRPLMNRIRGRLLTTNLAGYVAAYRCFVEGDAEIGDRLRQVTCPALAMTARGTSGRRPPCVIELPRTCPVSWSRLSLMSATAPRKKAQHPPTKHSFHSSR